MRKFKYDDYLIIFVFNLLLYMVKVTALLSKYHDFF